MRKIYDRLVALHDGVAAGLFFWSGSSVGQGDRREQNIGLHGRR